MTFKEKIFHHYLESINAQVSSFQNTLIDLRESAANETKSTVGDKHETALAMLQIEQANTSIRLKEALEKKNALEKVNVAAHTLKIIKGSLVKTNKGYLFLSAALGKINVNGITIIALSPESPLGSKLMGLKVNDTIELNRMTYVIESIE